MFFFFREKNWPLWQGARGNQTRCKRDQMFSTNENERESRKVYLWNSPYLFKFGFAGNTPHFYKEKTNPSIEEKSKAKLS